MAAAPVQRMLRVANVGRTQPGTTHLDIAQKNADINISNASLGLKLRAFRNLVLTGNVLLKLDNGGLRAKAVPLVGASYSF